MQHERHFLRGSVARCCGFQCTAPLDHTGKYVFQYRPSPRRRSAINTSAAVVVVVVVVVDISTITRRHDAIRGHRTDSNNSGVEDYLEEKNKTDRRRTYPKQKTKKSCRRALHGRPLLVTIVTSAAWALRYRHSCSFCQCGIGHGVGLDSDPTLVARARECELNTGRLCRE